MKIDLGIYGIVLNLVPGIEGHFDGTIRSDLHEESDLEDWDSDEQHDCDCYNAAMDTVESIILAHACAGVDIQAPAYLEGIHTSVHSCAKEWG